MFRFFRRTRVQNYLSNRSSEAGFKARSADRDAEADRLRRGSILAAIENALRAAEHEQSGLSRRVEDVLARASVTLGNGTDEYLEREPLDSYHQDLFSVEISNGQRRLAELAADISQFKFLELTMLDRYPNFKPPASTG